MANSGPQTRLLPGPEEGVIPDWVRSDIVKWRCGF